MYDAANHLLTYTGSSELEAIFVLAFRSTTKIQGIESVCESRGTSPNTYTDINSSVVANDAVSAIDVHFGHNEYIYTGSVGTVVSMTAASSPQWEVWKFIVGGTGENTLVINGSVFSSVPRPNGNYAKYQFMLLDHDVDLAKANRFPNAANQYAWPSTGENKVDRGIFLKNMQTIQLSNKATDDVSFQVDATNLRDGHRFIIDDARSLLRLVGTAGDDCYLLKRAVGADNQMNGYAGRNLLSLEYFEAAAPVTVDLDIKTGQSMAYLTAGTVSIGLLNIHSLYGHPRCTSIKGQAASNNLLIANGGSCVVEGRGGDNTLVAQRGLHTLVGGTGRDTYVIHGPELTELETISIIKDKTAGIVAKANGGVWANGVLTISLLASDTGAIQIVSAQLVDGQGVQLTTKGTFAISADKRQLVYTPGTAFSSLQNFESETVRVNYRTSGSVATIVESGQRNRIKLESITSKEAIRFTLSTAGDLECRNAAQQLVFVDTRWGELYRRGMTNIEALFVDFVTRFPELELGGGASGVGPLLKEGEILDVLYAQLGNRITAANNFDNMIDAALTTGNTVDVGQGSNTVLAKRRNVTYVGGPGDDTFDASVISATGAGTNAETLIKTGAGNDVVVIGGASTIPVKVSYIADGQTTKQGTKCLVVKGVDPNQLAITQTGTQLTLVTAGRTLAVLDIAPDAIFFRNSPQSALIEDVAGYVTARKANAAYNYRKIFNAAQEQGLRAVDLTREVLSLDVVVKSYGLDLTLRAGAQAVHTFRAAMATNAVVDAVAVCHAIQLELKAGIFLQNETLDAPRIRALVMDMLRSPSRHTIVGGTAFTNVVDMSKVTSPYTVPAGDTLLFANKAGTSVQAGRGNNLVKITASNQTVGTGPSRNEATGHKIVLLQANLRGLDVRLCEPGSTYNEGITYIVMDGLTAEELTFTGPPGKDMSYYSSGPFSMCYRGECIASFDAAPYYFLFRAGDEYEVVDAAAWYIQQTVRKEWKQRLYINRDGVAALKATEVTSSDLKIMLDGGWTPPIAVLQSSTVWNVNQFDLTGMTTSLKSGDVAVKLAAQMPGGLRLADRTYVGEALVTFLRSKLENAATCTKQRVTLTTAAPTLTLAQATPTVNSYKHFIDAINKTQQNVLLSRIDPPGTLVGVV